jgi:hypothetical protein
VQSTHRVDFDLDGLVSGNDAAVFNGAFSEGGFGATRMSGYVDFDGQYASTDAAIFNSFTTKPCRDFEPAKTPRRRLLHALREGRQPPVEFTWWDRECAVRRFDVRVAPNLVLRVNDPTGAIVDGLHDPPVNLVTVFRPCAGVGQDVLQHVAGGHRLQIRRPPRLGRKRVD